VKHALITFGNEESYGLLFVGGELLLYDQEIKYFDGEDENVVNLVTEWEPDFIMFSPMTTFFHRALKVARLIRQNLDAPKATCVFGGHHVMAQPSEVNRPDIDAVVIGPVRGSIQKILDGEWGKIYTKLTSPSDLPFPARAEYYYDIPRVASRYRKFMLSTLGCPWNCSYCSSSSGNMRRRFGLEDHRRYYLNQRPMDVIFNEAMEIASYPTKEIEWVDDDAFALIDYDWASEFTTRWYAEIHLPIYISTTSISVLRAANQTLRAFSAITSAVGLGVQAARSESLKLFNRSWDDEERMKAAYDRLVSFGFSVNLQAIVGLPVSDPVEDAMDTIKLLQRIGAGSICSVYPLQVYPDTKLEDYCRNDGAVALDAYGDGDTNTGVGGIRFGSGRDKQLRNICKLATMFVKYNIDEKWMRALIDIDFNDETSKNLSTVRYHDCLVDRLPFEGEKIFEKVLTATKLRY
jgi:hypothetical protein